MTHLMNEKTLGFSLLFCAALIACLAGFQVLAAEAPADAVEAPPVAEEALDPAAGEATETLPAAQPATECSDVLEHPLAPTTAASCTPDEPCWSHDDCGGLENGWCQKFEKTCWCA